MSESVIYCEGYHDRAFWMGWLGHLGCVDPAHLIPGGQAGFLFTIPGAPWSAAVSMLTTRGVGSSFGSSLVTGNPGSFPWCASAWGSGVPRRCCAWSSMLIRT